MKRAWQLIKTIFKEFSEDECPSRAGALAYYTILSLPPLLVMLLTLLGLVVDRTAAEQALFAQMKDLMGQKSAEAIKTMLTSAKSPANNALALALWLAALVAGSSGVFAQLQAALNRIWEVKPDPEQGGVKRFVLKRLLSFSMVVGIAFLLIVSLVVSAVLAAFGGLVRSYLPDDFSLMIISVVNFAFSFGVMTLLFAAMFKVLPDIRLKWRHVWTGAMVTALLFSLGKLAIGIYLGRSEVASAYGAAGSLVLVLVWLYYSSLILLFGAEFTQVWARRNGEAAAPENGAMRAATVEVNEHDVRAPAGEKLKQVNETFAPPMEQQKNG